MYGVDLSFFLDEEKNKIPRWRYIDSATVDLVLSFFRMQFAYLVSFTRVTKDVLHLCVCTCIGLCSLVLCWNVVKRMKQGSIKFYSATVEYIELLIGFVYLMAVLEENE